MTITPAILSNNFLTVQQQIDEVRFSSSVEFVHLDVIDGQFVDNLTVSPLDLTVGDFSPTKLDFHFMTEEPMDFVYECEALKEYLPIHRLIGQVERMSWQHDFLAEVRSNGWQAALALDLFTPLESIDDDVWSELDALLLMGVEAGYQGQALHHHLFDKLAELQSRLTVDQPFTVIIDGGVKLDNYLHLLKAGANELVVGSAIWNTNDPLGTLERFYRLAGESLPE